MCVGLDTLYRWMDEVGGVIVSVDGWRRWAGGWFGVVMVVVVVAVVVAYILLLYER